MLCWAEDAIRELVLEDIGEHYGRYRLHVPEAERAMARSLERYGQISPMVVCLRIRLNSVFSRLKSSIKHWTSSVRPDSC